MDYTLIRSRRRSLCLEVKAGKLLVRAPQLVGQKTIDNFVSEKEDWVKKKIAESRRRRQKKKIPSPRSKAKLIDKLKKYLREALPRLCKSDLRGYRVRVKIYRSKWGSCSRKTLSFNAKLALAPCEVVDYVIIHEIAHIKHKNHGRRFWREVEKRCSNYRKLRKWLAKNNGDLMV